MRRALSPAVALAWLAFGPGPAVAAEPPALTVFAAADLTFAFRELAPRFEKATGVRVTLVFGSTGNFAHQIREGGPADVFFAADQSFVDALAAERVLLADTRTLYAQGRIVLATPRVFGPKLTELRGLLDPRVRRVAIANPAHAPYGRAAAEALKKTGLWEAVRPKLVFGENIRHTLQFLQTGAVDAGIVALSVANVPEVDWVVIDASLHAPLNQEAAVVLPLVLPPTVLGYYLLLVIGSRGPVGRALAALGLELAFTWGAAVLAACVGSIALVIKSAQAGFEGVDRQLEQAARTLGRSEWSVFWSVTLPLAWRSVLAGTVLAFCRALGEFGITLMVAGNIPGRTQTLPLAIYDRVQGAQMGEANALALIAVAVVVVLLFGLRRAGEGRGG